MMDSTVKHDGRYFDSAVAANEWLAFYEGDQNSGEADRKLATEPDRYGEWEIWRAKGHDGTCDVCEADTTIWLYADESDCIGICLSCEDELRKAWLEMTPEQRAAEIEAVRADHES